MTTGTVLPPARDVPNIAGGYDEAALDWDDNAPTSAEDDASTWTKRKPIMTHGGSPSR